MEFPRSSGHGIVSWVKLRLRLAEREAVAPPRTRPVRSSRAVTVYSCGCRRTRCSRRLRVLHLVPLRPRAPIDQLLLGRREERFGDGVVVGRADLAHRSGDAVGPGKLVEGQAHVSRALVGAVNMPRFRSSPADCHFESIGDQLGSHVIGHRPADDSARIEVLDGGLDPALPAPEVGDVGNPFRVRFSCGQVPEDQVVSDPDPGHPKRALAAPLLDQP